ncbi:unnamed protein product [Didymodactylos carnosus]|uniref:SET domain-containing protein n=1 Tax=Didymodactylos carnosus TaxID=1234261 RepID=A0A815G9Z6_9BILA|nr:unnamed protein product [Didymodactylos carnosus]CAF1614347.1 unnamed protein product [Didymodactylos carnosus]CAF4194098.1 unnamed protein product [Didymodactylos carnosus]CAF4430012.1 unnamed protein product [Didymodactylos carnosus]
MGEKYDDNEQKSIVALENINKGELVSRCDLSICNYDYPIKEDAYCTRDELLKLIEKYPLAEQYLTAYSVMIDDNCFHVPKYYKECKITEPCVYFNHSCDPNCAYASDDLLLVFAIKDIHVNEELTLHYGTVDTEESLLLNLNCKCGSTNCSKILKFD